MAWPDLGQLFPGILRPVDYHFGRLLGRYAQADAQAVALAGALASRAVGAGHTALDFRAPVLEHAPVHVQPIDGAALRESLLHEPTVCTVLPGDAKTPLLIDGNRLYLQRYWRYERQLAERICRLLGEPPPVIDGASEFLDELFPDQSAVEQKLAVAIALTSSFAIITGGPGTGKTSSVARLLTLLIRQGPLHMGLAAPTGKAAARLSESLWEQLEGLQEQGYLSETNRQQIPDKAMTLHRLLGARSGLTQFRYHAGNPLPLDLLLIDEASMIDLHLMHAVLDALPTHCRLILLGDRDQLSAVEAGNVFGELCRDASRVSARRLKELQRCLPDGLESAPEARPLSDVIGVLSHSYRFAGRGGIGRLATAVNRGDVAEVRLCLADPNPELDVLRYAVNEMDDVVAKATGEYALYFHAVHQGDDAYRILELRASFQLLCALREGPEGVSGLNSSIERELARQGLIPAGQTQYPGQPVLITRNDNSLKLFNGDLGVLLADKEERLMACFAQPGGNVLRVAAARLPAHETAFALTVHKSQGSEFDRVMLLLPRSGSSERAGLIRRELLYTGITRARSQLMLAMHDGRFEDAWLVPSTRHSGLADQIDRLGQQ